MRVLHLLPILELMIKAARYSLSPPATKTTFLSLGVDVHAHIKNAELS